MRSTPQGCNAGRFLADAPCRVGGCSLGLAPVRLPSPHLASGFGSSGATAPPAPPDGQAANGPCASTTLAARRSPGTSARPSAMPLVALVCVAIAVYPLFLERLLPHSYDVGTYFGPSWAFLAHSLREGSLPSWNPFVFGGAPFTGDPQTQALYPPTLILFGLLSLPTATLCWFGFHYLLATGGTYCLARNLNLSGPASAIASIAYAASTYLVARAQAPILLTGAAWLPVVLAAAVGAAARPDAARPMFLDVRLACAFALQVLSGSQQVVLLTAAACVVAAALLRGRRLVVTTFASLALGTMLAAPQLLPMASLVAGSTASSGIDVNGFGALSWADRSILAGAFASTRSETAPIYLGVMGLGQALVGLVSGWKRRPVQVILGLGALSLFWAFGLAGRLVSPIAPALATVTAHQPVRALPLTVLALALGIGTFWDHAVSVRRSLIAISGSAGGYLIAGTLGPASYEVWLLSTALGVAVLAIASRWRRAVWPLILAGLALSVDLALHNVDLRNTHQPPAVWQAATDPLSRGAGKCNRTAATWCRHRRCEIRMDGAPSRPRPPTRARSQPGRPSAPVAWRQHALSPANDKRIQPDHRPRVDSGDEELERSRDPGSPQPLRHSRPYQNVARLFGRRIPLRTS